MDATDNYTKIKELVFDSFIQNQCDAAIESFLFDHSDLDSAMESEESVKKEKDLIGEWVNKKYKPKLDRFDKIARDAADKGEKAVIKVTEDHLVNLEKLLKELKSIKVENNPEDAYREHKNYYRIKTLNGAAKSAFVALILIIVKLIKKKSGVDLLAGPGNGLAKLLIAAVAGPTIHNTAMYGAMKFAENYAKKNLQSDHDKDTLKKGMSNYITSAEGYKRMMISEIEEHIDRSRNIVNVLKQRMNQKV